MLSGHTAKPVDPPARDGVGGLENSGTPTIVSISDIHGLLKEARSALLTLDDHPEYDPIVERGRRIGELQWAGGENHVLVFNGDLIDRGPQNDDVVEMVERLIDQAPPGHVRVTFGNHEMGVLVPDSFSWREWYSMTRTDDQRREFVRSIEEGHVVGSYEGYNLTYAHAGRKKPYHVADINEELLEGARTIGGGIGSDSDRENQEALSTLYPEVFGLDGETGRGPNAGIAWLDFEHLPSDAPRQVVGHTRQQKPVRRGNVICENVLRENRWDDGGEAVLIETPGKVAALGRRPDGGVQEYTFSLSAGKGT